VDGPDDHLDRLQAGETCPAAELDAARLRRDTFGTCDPRPELGRASRGPRPAHLDCDARHHQPYGIVHGGVWCAVVESMASIGAAVNAASHGQLVVGVSNTTDFLRAHRTGRVDAVAEPIHVGRTQQLWQVVLTRATTARPSPAARSACRALPDPSSGRRTRQSAGAPRSGRGGDGGP
jgi:1,4-dihydroxy-2-naphthoyl-CoA hydrolase